MKTRAGTTLIELLLVLTLLGILSTFALPEARAAFNIAAVRAARENAFALAMRARSIAVARGGADLSFDLPAHTISVADAQGVPVVSTPISSYDVAITIDGAPVTRVVLRFDAYGIGRMTSRTIHFRKGEAEAGLTFSSFGRVRRW